jgi:KUP system potassium uptake protein
MRADNRGEGGSLALLSLVTERAANPRLSWAVTLLGIFAAALFYGDSMITPAISVLSAVEGLEIIAPTLKPYVIPLTVVILTGCSSSRNAAPAPSACSSARSWCSGSACSRCSA